MKLYPENAKAPVVSKISETDGAVKEAAKALIKSFVKEPTEYYAIIKHVEAEIGLGKITDIKAIINEVRDEWHPVKADEIDVEMSK